MNIPNQPIQILIARVYTVLKVLLGSDNLGSHSNARIRPPDGVLVRLFVEESPIVL